MRPVALGTFNITSRRWPYPLVGLGKAIKMLISYCPDSDPNCGAAFTAAEPDFLDGTLLGCGQENPNITAEAPAVMPVCLPLSS